MVKFDNQGGSGVVLVQGVLGVLEGLRVPIQGLLVLGVLGVWIPGVLVLG